MADGGVLTGPEIHTQIDQGNIEVDPFDPKYINPGSIDLTLGSKVAVYQQQVYVAGSDWRGTTDREGNLLEGVRAATSLRGGENLKPLPDEVKWKEAPVVHTFDIHPDRGWLLKPGIGYLMHTAERVCTRKFVPVLDGKSSIGRLFVAVHVTAGYGDTGFDGQYTLEVVSTFPVRVYTGMRIAQMRFHTIVGDIMDYQIHGNYVREASMGPVPSRAWKQR